MPPSSVPQPPEGPRPVRAGEVPPRGFRLRDVDAAERALVLRALGWGGIPGAFLGGAGAWLWTLEAETALRPLLILLGAILVGTVTTLLPVALARLAGGAALVALGSSGHAPARRKEYSFAESLAARGLFQKAVTAYEEAIGDDPSDPEPYLRIGRIYRDELGRPEDAARWFKRARSEAELRQGQDLFVSRELIELFRHRLRRPEKALPELARLAELHEGTPDAEWAAAELRKLKSELGD